MRLEFSQMSRSCDVTKVRLSLVLCTQHPWRFAASRTWHASPSGAPLRRSFTRKQWTKTEMDWRTLPGLNEGEFAAAEWKRLSFWTKRSLPVGSLTPLMTTALETWRRSGGKKRWPPRRTPSLSPRWTSCVRRSWASLCQIPWSTTCFITEKSRSVVRGGDPVCLEGHRSRGTGEGGAPLCISSVLDCPLERSSLSLTSVNTVHKLRVFSQKGESPLEEALTSCSQESLRSVCGDGWETVPYTRYPASKRKTEVEINLCCL